MNRTILAMALVAAFISTGAEAFHDHPQGWGRYNTCDADMNGKIKASDALSALKAAVGAPLPPRVCEDIRTASNQIRSTCDSNRDGVVTAGDALRALKQAVGAGARGDGGCYNFQVSQEETVRAVRLYNPDWRCASHGGRLVKTSEVPDDPYGYIDTWGIHLTVTGERWEDDHPEFPAGHGGVSTSMKRTTTGDYWERFDRPSEYNDVFITYEATKWYVRWTKGNTSFDCPGDTSRWFYWEDNKGKGFLPHDRNIGIRMEVEKTTPWVPNVSSDNRCGDIVHLTFWDEGAMGGPWLAPVKIADISGRRHYSCD